MIKCTFEKDNSRVEVKGEMPVICFELEYLLRTVREQFTEQFNDATARALVTECFTSGMLDKDIAVERKEEMNRNIREKDPEIAERVHLKTKGLMKRLGIENDD